MKAIKKAGQLTSWYKVTTAPIRAIVSPILINSPKKKLIGLAPPGFRALIVRRNAKKAFGIAQHSPPNKAEMLKKSSQIHQQTARRPELPSFAAVRYAPCFPHLIYRSCSNLPHLPRNIIGQRKSLPIKTTELYVVVRNNVKRYLQCTRMRHCLFFYQRSLFWLSCASHIWPCSQTPRPDSPLICPFAPTE